MTNYTWNNYITKQYFQYYCLYWSGTALYAVQGSSNLVNKFLMCGYQIKATEQFFHVLSLFFNVL